LRCNIFQLHVFISFIYRNETVLGSHDISPKTTENQLLRSTKVYVAGGVIIILMIGFILTALLTCRNKDSVNQHGKKEGFNDLYKNEEKGDFFNLI
jgi:hypothetical protein